MPPATAVMMTCPACRKQARSTVHSRAARTAEIHCSAMDLGRSYLTAAWLRSFQPSAKSLRLDFLRFTPQTDSIMQLTLNTTPNRLLAPPADPVADPAVIRVATMKRPIAKRARLEVMRQQSAAEAVADLARDGMELFGLTRGQFSLADLLVAILEKTGAAALSISTWTAAHADVERMMALLESGQITGCRWLVDQTLPRRTPALAAQIRNLFGDDAIRVTKTHAKFATIVNDEWQVALRSSMNLNQNPRLECFQVGHDPELCQFLGAALDDIWRRQHRSITDAPASVQTAWWNDAG